MSAKVGMKRGNDTMKLQGSPATNRWIWHQQDVA